MLWSLVCLQLAGLGPEIGVAPPGPNAPAANLQWDPDVASDGTDFVVVWSDKRYEESTHRTFGTRIRRDGLVLDPVGIPLGPLHSDRARVTHLGGGRYAVSWALDGTVSVRVLRSDGTWEGPAVELRVNDYVSCGHVDGVGDQLALAYLAGTDVKARRFFVDGGSPDVMPALLTIASASGVCPTVATSLGPMPAWTVAWVEGSTLRDAFLPAAGPPTSTGVLSSTLATAPAISKLVPLPGGAHYLAWASGSSPLRPLQGITASAMGTTTAEPLWPADGGVWDFTFTHGADGRLRGFLTLGDYGNDGYRFLYVPADGGAVELGPGGSDAPGYQGVLAASSDRLLLALGMGDDVAYQLLDQQFTLIDAGIAGMSGAGQHGLHLASSGTSYLAVWTERFGSYTNVLARRLDATGMPVGPTQVLNGVGTRASAPSAAFTQGTWAVVWDDDSSRSHFQLLTEAGQRGPTAQLRAGAVAPHVIADGSRFALVFVDRNTDELYFAPLERDGGMGASTKVADPSGFPYAPRIARGDGGFLVVWQNSAAAEDIHGARLTATGESLDPTGFPIVATGDVELSPQVAFDGEAYVVSYRSYTQTRWVRVRGTSVSAPYEAFRPGDLSANRQTATTSQPGGVLVASCDSDTGRVSARQLVPYGAGLDGGPVLDVGVPPEHTCEPAIAGTGNVLFGYGRFDLTQQAMSAKVRLFTKDPEGAPCIDHWRCLTGYCGAGGTCSQPPSSGAGGGTSGAGGGSGAGGSGGTGGSAGASGAPSHLGIGCGCSSAGAPLMLALLLLARRRRAFSPRDRG